MDILRRQCIKFEKDVADHEKKQEEFAAYKTTVSRMIAGLEKEKDDFVDALTEREQVYVAQICYSLSTTCQLLHLIFIGKGWTIGLSVLPAFTRRAIACACV